MRPGETNVVRAFGTEHDRDAHRAKLLGGGFHILDQELHHRSGGLLPRRLRNPPAHDHSRNHRVDLATPTR